MLLGGVALVMTGLVCLILAPAGALAYVVALPLGLAAIAIIVVAAQRRNRSLQSVGETPLAPVQLLPALVADLAVVLIGVVFFFALAKFGAGQSLLGLGLYALLALIVLGGVAASLRVMLAMRRR